MEIEQMETNEIKRIVETLLFVSTKPLSIKKIVEVVDIDSEEAEKIVNELCEEYQSRAIQIQNVAGGYLFATRKEYSSWIRKLFKDKTTLKISSSALETLSVIAYRQPVTRAEIEEIRGVDVSGVLETLLEKKLVRTCGRKETLGRPLLYGTTTEFLKYFGLRNLSELPPWEEFQAEIEENMTNDEQT